MGLTAAAGATSDANAPTAAAHTATGGDNAATSAAASAGTASCPWKRYQDPASKRMWLYNEETEDFFFVDRPSPWNSYLSPEGRRWWYHEDKPWFWDDLALQGD